MSIFVLTIIGIVVAAMIASAVVTSDISASSCGSL